MRSTSFTRFLAVCLFVCLFAGIFSQPAKANSVTLRLDAAYAAGQLMSGGSVSGLWFTDTAIVHSTDANGNFVYRQIGDRYYFVNISNWSFDASTMLLIQSYVDASRTGDWSAFGYEEHLTDVAFYNLSSSALLDGRVTVPFFHVIPATAANTETTLTVRTFFRSDDAPDPGPAGVIINVNDIESGLTGADGTLTRL